MVFPARDAPNSSRSGVFIGAGFLRWCVCDDASSNESNKWLVTSPEPAAGPRFRKTTGLFHQPRNFAPFDATVERKSSRTCNEFQRSTMKIPIRALLINLSLVLSRIYECYSNALKEISLSISKSPVTLCRCILSVERNQNLVTITFDHGRYIDTIVFGESDPRVPNIGDRLIAFRWHVKTCVIGTKKSDANGQFGCCGKLGLSATK